MSTKLRFGCRTARRLLTIGLAAALAGPVAALEAHIERASGAVELGRGEPPAWQAAQAGETLAPGEVLRTGRDGRAELSWQGATIRLYGDSLLRLPEAGATAVELEAGSGLFDVEPRSGAPFEVRTPEVVVSVKGTRFAVALDTGPAEIAVYRGMVGVRALALEREVLVREGFRALGASDEPAELFLLDGPDPWSEWGPRAQPPRRSAQAPPAKRAVEDARQAGRAAIRSQALKLALERNPRLVEQIAELRARLEHPDGEAVLAPGLRGALPDPAQGAERLGAAFDRRLAALEPLLDDRVVSAWLNGGLGRPAELDVVPDRSRRAAEIVDRAAGGQWDVDESLLRGVVTGTQSLPPDLATRFQQRGIDPAQAAAMMLTLF